MTGSEFFAAGVAAFTQLFDGIADLGWFSWWIFVCLFISVIFITLEVLLGVETDV